MKKLTVVLFLSLFAFVCQGQEYSFSLYFEDSAGNRDTLVFGFNKSASIGIDSALGEVNFISETYDSSLFAFFTNATSYDENIIDCYLEQTKKPTFVSKHQITNNNYDPIEIGIISKNWPITISWNESDIKNWGINNFFNSEKLQLIMTSWNPPGGWFDALCCGGAWPDDYTVMANTGKVSIDQNIPCYYKANYTNDSISLLFIGIESTTVGVDDFCQGDILFSYNYVNRTLNVHNNGIAKRTDLIISDVSGKIILKESINLSSGVETFSMENIASGLYVISISDKENHKILNLQKIYMR